METRRPIQKKLRAPTTPLPVDFIKLVVEVFSANFDEGLKKLAHFSKDYGFEAFGSITADEVLLSVSICSTKLFQATTVHASVDFDPKANSPTSPDLLNACVDAIGSVMTTLLDAEDPNRIAQIAANSLASFKDIPWEWTPLETPLATGSAQVYLRVDKARPLLDKMADDWLAKNDPDHQARLEREERETEKLFVTGAKRDVTDEDDIDEEEEEEDLDTDPDESDSDPELVERSKSKKKPGSLH